MNKITKKLLLEIMSFLNTREFKKEDVYVRNAFTKIDERTLVIRLGNLLHWIDPRDHFSFTDLEKYVIYEDFMTEEVIKKTEEQFSSLFKFIPELNEIFVFKDRAIKFNSSLNEADIQEIYSFVKKNYTPYITRYIRPAKE